MIEIRSSNLELNTSKFNYLKELFKLIARMIKEYYFEWKDNLKFVLNYSNYLSTNNYSKL